METTFPHHFRWDVATSAHQVEGYNFHEYVARIPPVLQPWEEAPDRAIFNLD